jgi:hypothetical protein
MNQRRLRRGAPLPFAHRTLPGARPLTMAMLGAGLLLQMNLSPAAERAPRPDAASQARHFDIAPAPLADALNRFAAEAGVVLVFDAATLRATKSPGLKGSHDLRSGFAALLAGTPLEAVPAPSGGFLLRRKPERLTTAPVAAAAAASAVADPPTPVPHRQTLPLVAVKGAALGTVQQLDRAMLRNLAALNGDLTSQLKLNPAVQFDESLLSSNTAGEIAPAEISIHGAKPYQNEILLDGVSLMNDLDPGNKITTSSPEFVPGRAQSLAVDTSILCEVGVRDANVSAEHGRFTGGVVEAKICAARKKLGGQLAFGYTSSDWTQVFIDPARRSEFDNSSTADLQPRFLKRTYKATVEGRPSAEWGLLLSAVRRTADIPLHRFTTTNDGTTESREVTQTRQQDTLVFKTDYAPAGGVHKGDLSMVYAPSDNRYFIEDYRQSDYTIRTGGLNLSGRWETAFGFGTLTHQLSFSDNEQSRRSEADYYRNWRWSADKNWGDGTVSNPTSGEGAWGDVDQRLRSASYKFKAALHPLAVGATTHRLVTGAELRRQGADYERLKTQRYYLQVADLPRTGAIARCERADGSVDAEACSATPSANRSVGQYFRRLMTYTAGRFAMDAHAGSAFVEDEIQWRKFSLRAGLRADHDSLTGDTNAAPRLQLGWAPVDTLSLDVGANRYYGRSLFAYALQEKIHTLLVTQTRNGTLTWGAAEQALPENRLEDLKTPHDDELTVGALLDPTWLGGPLSLRFTHRDGKNQVVKRQIAQQSGCNANRCYVYTNDGRSTTQDWTLSWSSAAAIKTGPVVTRLWAAVNKSDVRSNVSTYADNFSTDQFNDVMIQYDGRFIRYADIPADNYNRPWTLRIGLMSTAPARSLTVSHVLRLRGSYQQVLNTGTTEYQGTTVDVYERTALPRSFAVDTVIHWEPRVYRDQRLSLKLTVENLTNRKNKTSVNDTYASYERGRAIALEVGYDF